MYGKLAMHKHFYLTLQPMPHLPMTLAHAICKKINVELYLESGGIFALVCWTLIPNRKISTT